jgi:hypothetical protein
MYKPYQVKEELMKINQNGSIFPFKSTLLMDGNRRIVFLFYKDGLEQMKHRNPRILSLCKPLLPSEVYPIEREE